MSSDNADRAKTQEFFNWFLNLQPIEDDALDRIVKAAGIGPPVGFDREGLRYELQSVVQWEAIFGRPKRWPRPSDRKRHAEKILKAAMRLQSELREEELTWWFMNDVAFRKQEEAQHAFAAGLARVIEGAELMVSPSLSVWDDTPKSGLRGVSATIAAHIVPIFEKHFGQEATITTPCDDKEDPKGAIIGFVQAVARELKLFPKYPKGIAVNTVVTAVKQLRTFRNKIK